MEVRLRPWAVGDLALLRRLNTPEQLAHLGGPETDEAVVARHEKYLAAEQGIFVIEDATTGEVSGTIVWWERVWTGREIQETGWSVVPEMQGRGVATAAAREVVRRLRESHRNRELHAFPGVDNAASNGVCRAAGFRLLGEAVVEYPKGRWMRVNDWVVDLDAPARG